MFLANQKSGVGASSISGLESGGLSTSRLGLTGREDLGGGLAAIFKLEAALGIDVGQSTAGGALQFNRESWVGFEGGFGTVTAGKVWTALDDVWYVPNSAFDSLFAPGNDVLSIYNYAANPGNTVKYVTPDLGGFVGAVSYKGKGSGIFKQTDVSATYTMGSLTLLAGHQKRENTATNVDQKFTLLGGTYDFGAAKLMAAYNTTRNVTAAKTDEWQIGVEVPLSGRLSISGGYASSEDDGADKRTGLGIAAKYSLSKRTDLYTGIRTNRTKDVAGVKVDEGRLFGVGVRHAF